MADVKKLQTRIALKYDTYANWALDNEATQAAKTNANLVLLKGEIGICEIPSGNSNATTAPTVLFKVGDGTTPFKALKWASALAADVYSWAKASDVTIVYNEDGTKGIKFIDGAVDAEGNKIDKVVPINFATPEEVAAAVKVVADDLDALTSRVAAVEGSIGTGAVATDIADLKSRMTTAEGDIDTLESTKLDASEFAAFNNGTSKTVAAIEADIVDKASAAETAAKGHADSIVATEKSNRESADAALGGRIDALVGDNGTIAAGDAATLEAAKSYADTKKSEVIGDASSTKDSDTVKGAKLFATDAANTAKAGAEATAAAALEAAVQTLTNKDNALVAEDSRLAGLISNNATAIENITKAETGAIAVAVKNVTDAYTTAIGTAKTELEGKITAEENARKGAIDTLTQTVNTNAGTVTSEIARVEGLIEDEAKARDDADKALDARLDKVETFFEGAYTEDGQPVKEALDTLVEIQNYITGEGEAASALLDAIEANATAIEGLSDRMDTAEDDIDSLEGRATAVENRATALETLAAGFGEGETVLGKINAAAALGQTGIDNAATAQAAAEAADGKAVDAQTRLTTLETTTVPGVKTIAENAGSEAARAHGRLDTAEGKISTLETASAKHAEKTYVDDELAKKVDKDSYATDKQVTTEALDARYTKTEADNKFGLKSAVEKNATDIATNAAAIAANAGNIAANTTAIGAEETRALAQEAAIRSEFATADQGIYDKIGDVGTGTVAKAISDAQTAAQTYADGKVEAIEKGAVATNASNISAVSGRVDAIEEKFMGWFVIDCGNSTTVIDETK